MNTDWFKSTEQQTDININVLVIGRGAHLLVFDNSSELRGKTLKLDDFKPFCTIGGVSVHYSIYAIEAPKTVLFGLIERLLAVKAKFEIFDLDKCDFDHPNMAPDMIPAIVYNPADNTPVVRVRPIMQDATDS